jgi:hypothetical protein
LNAAAARRSSLWLFPRTSGMGLPPPPYLQPRRPLRRAPERTVARHAGQATPLCADTGNPSYLLATGIEDIVLVGPLLGRGAPKGVVAGATGDLLLPVQGDATLGTWRCYRWRPALLPLVSVGGEFCYLNCLVLLPAVRGGVALYGRSCSNLGRRCCRRVLMSDEVSVMRICNI